MEQKILFTPDRNEKKDESAQIISGPVCAINPGMKGDKLYKGGALTSAFMGAFL